MEQFQASPALVSGLASAVGCAPACLCDELSSRVPMFGQRVAGSGFGSITRHLITPTHALDVLGTPVPPAHVLDSLPVGEWPVK